MGGALPRGALARPLRAGHGDIRGGHRSQEVSSGARGALSLGSNPAYIQELYLIAGPPTLQRSVKSCLKQPLAQGFFQADGAHLQGLEVPHGPGLPPLVTSRIRASADLALLRGAHRGAPGLHLALRGVRGVSVTEEVRGQTCLVGGCWRLGQGREGHRGTERLVC